MLNRIVEDDGEISVGAGESELGDRDSSSLRRVVSEITQSKYESLFEKETKQEQKYSLKNAKLDRSFCYHLGAMFFMRWGIIKRNKKMVFSEIFMPGFLAFLGLCLMQISFYKQSDSNLVNFERLPSPIRILVN